MHTSVKHESRQDRQWTDTHCETHAVSQSTQYESCAVAPTATHTHIHSFPQMTTAPHRRHQAVTAHRHRTHSAVRSRSASGPLSCLESRRRGDWCVVLYCSVACLGGLVSDTTPPRLAPRSSVVRHAAAPLPTPHSTAHSTQCTLTHSLSRLCVRLCSVS